ncbi:hypothetical protein QQS21_005137 [Conoideocrella luteorostrata]|uniref:Uncharacterized protein n=1 Tax=Conoideocrella luteorostrata TaxID=1105319 RepID=A0AAJ0G147_9HYPO|nr:hypothetical protein QQS21_005137 [Conoideocrella luteorostrata]
MLLRQLKTLRVAGLRLTTTRSYYGSPSLRLPYKDSQDRNSLKPQSTEHVKSGRDDDAAAASNTAFGKGGNNPEEARNSASREEGGDPLEMSGANHELSKPQGDEGGKNQGAGKEVGKGGSSGGRGATKRGGAGKLS